MTTAIITKTTTETFRLNLDSPMWPDGMTDEQKLTAWLNGACKEPDIATAYLATDSVAVVINGEIEK